MCVYFINNHNTGFSEGGCEHYMHQRYGAGQLVVVMSSGSEEVLEWVTITIKAQ